MSLQSTSMLRSGASHLASAAPSGAAVGYVYVRDKDTATSVTTKCNGSTTPFHVFIRSLEAYLDKINLLPYARGTVSVLVGHFTVSGAPQPHNGHPVFQPSAQRFTVPLRHPSPSDSEGMTSADLRQSTNVQMEHVDELPATAPSTDMSGGAQTNQPNVVISEENANSIGGSLPAAQQDSFQNVAGDVSPPPVPLMNPFTGVSQHATSAFAQPEPTFAPNSGFYRHQQPPPPGPNDTASYESVQALHSTMFDDESAGVFYQERNRARTSVDVGSFLVLQPPFPQDLYPYMYTKLANGHIRLNVLIAKFNAPDQFGNVNTSGQPNALLHHVTADVYTVNIKVLYHLVLSCLSGSCLAWARNESIVPRNRGDILFQLLIKRYRPNTVYQLDSARERLLHIEFRSRLTGKSVIDHIHRMVQYLHDAAPDPNNPPSVSWVLVARRIASQLHSDHYFSKSMEKLLSEHWSFDRLVDELTDLDYLNNALGKVNLETNKRIGGQEVQRIHHARQHTRGTHRVRRQQRGSTKKHAARSSIAHSDHRQRQHDKKLKCRHCAMRHDTDKCNMPGGKMYNQASLVNLSLGYIIAASHEMNPSVWARLPKEVTDRIRGLDKAAKKSGKSGKSSKNFKKKQARSVKLTDGSSVAIDAHAGGKQMQKSARVKLFGRRAMQSTVATVVTHRTNIVLPAALFQLGTSVTSNNAGDGPGICFVATTHSGKPKYTYPVSPSTNESVPLFDPAVIEDALASQPEHVSLDRLRGIWSFLQEQPFYMLAVAIDVSNVTFDFDPHRFRSYDAHRNVITVFRKGLLERSAYVCMSGLEPVWLEDDYIPTNYGMQRLNFIGYLPFGDSELVKIQRNDFAFDQVAALLVDHRLVRASDEWNKFPEQMIGAMVFRSKIQHPPLPAALFQRGTSVSSNNAGDGPHGLCFVAFDSNMESIHGPHLQGSFRVTHPVTPTLEAKVPLFEHHAHTKHCSQRPMRFDMHLLRAIWDVLDKQENYMIAVVIDLNNATVASDVNLSVWPGFDADRLTITITRDYLLFEDNSYICVSGLSGEFTDSFAALNFDASRLNFVGVLPSWRPNPSDQTPLVGALGSPGFFFSQYSVFYQNERDGIVDAYNDLQNFTSDVIRAMVLRRPLRHPQIPLELLQLGTSVSSNNAGDGPDLFGLDMSEDDMDFQDTEEQIVLLPVPSLVDLLNLDMQLAIVSNSKHVVINLHGFRLDADLLALLFAHFHEQRSINGLPVASVVFEFGGHTVDNSSAALASQLSVRGGDGSTIGDRTCDQRRVDVFGPVQALATYHMLRCNGWSIAESYSKLLQYQDRQCAQVPRALQLVSASRVSVQHTCLTSDMSSAVHTMLRFLTVADDHRIRSLHESQLLLRACQRRQFRSPVPVYSFVLETHWYYAHFSHLLLECWQRLWHTVAHIGDHQRHLGVIYPNTIDGDGPQQSQFLRRRDLFSYSDVTTSVEYLGFWSGGDITWRAPRVRTFCVRISATVIQKFVRGHLVRSHLHQQATLCDLLDQASRVAWMSHLPVLTKVSPVHSILDLRVVDTMCDIGDSKLQSAVELFESLVNLCLQIQQPHLQFFKHCIRLMVGTFRSIAYMSLDSTNIRERIEQMVDLLDRLHFTCVGKDVGLYLTGAWICPVCLDDPSCSALYPFYGSLSCGWCSQVFYCSDRCMQLHLPLHRLVCRPMWPMSLQALTLFRHRQNSALQRGIRPTNYLFPPLAPMSFIASTLHTLPEALRQLGVTVTSTDSGDGPTFNNQLPDSPWLDLNGWAVAYTIVVDLCKLHLGHIWDRWGDDAPHLKFTHLLVSSEDETTQLAMSPLRLSTFQSAFVYLMVAGMHAHQHGYNRFDRVIRMLRKIARAIPLSSVTMAPTKRQLCNDTIFPSAYYTMYYSCLAYEDFYLEFSTDTAIRLYEQDYIGWIEHFDDFPSCAQQIGLLGLESSDRALRLDQCLFAWFVRLLYPKLPYPQCVDVASALVPDPADGQLYVESLHDKIVNMICDHNENNHVDCYMVDDCETECWSVPERNSLCELHSAKKDPSGHCSSQLSLLFRINAIFLTGKRTYKDWDFDEHQWVKRSAYRSDLILLRKYFAFRCDQHLLASPYLGHEFGKTPEGYVGYRDWAVAVHDNWSGASCFELDMEKQPDPDRGFPGWFKGHWYSQCPQNYRDMYSACFSSSPAQGWDSSSDGSLSAAQGSSHGWGGNEEKADETQPAFSSDFAEKFPSVAQVVSDATGAIPDATQRGQTVHTLSALETILALVDPSSVDIAAKQAVLLDDGKTNSEQTVAGEAHLPSSAQDRWAAVELSVEVLLRSGTHFDALNVNCREYFGFDPDVITPDCFSPSKMFEQLAKHFGVELRELPTELQSIKIFKDVKQAMGLHARNLDQLQMAYYQIFNALRKEVVQTVPVHTAEIVDDFSNTDLHGVCQRFGFDLSLIPSWFSIQSYVRRLRAIRSFDCSKKTRIKHYRRLVGELRSKATHIKRQKLRHERVSKKPAFHRKHHAVKRFARADAATDPFRHRAAAAHVVIQNFYSPMPAERGFGSGYHHGNSMHSHRNKCTHRTVKPVISKPGPKHDQHFAGHHRRKQKRRNKLRRKAVKSAVPVADKPSMADVASAVFTGLPMKTYKHKALMWRQKQAAVQALNSLPTSVMSSLGAHDVFVTASQFAELQSFFLSNPAWIAAGLTRGNADTYAVRIAERGMTLLHVATLVRQHASAIERWPPELDVILVFHRTAMMNALTFLFRDDPSPVLPSLTIRPSSPARAMFRSATPSPEKEEMDSVQYSDDEEHDQPPTCASEEKALPAQSPSGPARLVRNLGDRFAAMQTQAEAKPSPDPSHEKLLVKVQVSRVDDNGSHEYFVWRAPDGRIFPRCGAVFDNIETYSRSLFPTRVLQVTFAQGRQPESKLRLMQKIDEDAANTDDNMFDAEVCADLPDRAQAKPAQISWLAYSAAQHAGDFDVELHRWLDSACSSSIENNIMNFHQLFVLDPPVPIEVAAGDDALCRLSGTIIMKFWDEEQKTFIVRYRNVFYCPEAGAKLLATKQLVHAFGSVTPESRGEFIQRSDGRMQVASLSITFPHRTRVFPAMYAGIVGCECPAIAVECVRDPIFDGYMKKSASEQQEIVHQIISRSLHSYSPPALSKHTAALRGLHNSRLARKAAAVCNTTVVPANSYDNHVTQRVGHNPILDHKALQSEKVFYMEQPPDFTAAKYNWTPPKPSDLQPQAPQISHEQILNQGLIEDVDRKTEIAALSTHDRQRAEEFQLKSKKAAAEIDALMAADGGMLGCVRPAQNVTVRLLHTPPQLPVPFAVHHDEYTALQAIAPITDAAVTEQQAHVARLRSQHTPELATPPISPVGVISPTQAAEQTRVHVDLKHIDIIWCVGSDDVALPLLDSNHCPTQQQLCSLFSAIAALKELSPDGSHALACRQKAFERIQRQIDVMRNKGDVIDEPVLEFVVPRAIYSLRVSKRVIAQVFVGPPTKLSHEHLKILKHGCSLSSHLQEQLHTTGQRDWPIKFLNFCASELVEHFYIGPLPGSTQLGLFCKHDMTYDEASEFSKMLRFDSPIKLKPHLASQLFYQRWLVPSTQKCVTDETFYRSVASFARVLVDGPSTNSWYRLRSGRLGPVQGSTFSAHEEITVSLQRSHAPAYLRSMIQVYTSNGHSDAVTGSHLFGPATAPSVSASTSTSVQQSQSVTGKPRGTSRKNLTTVGDTTRNAAAYHICHTVLDLFHKRLAHRSASHLLEHWHYYFPDEPICSTMHVCSACIEALMVKKPIAARTKREKRLGFIEIDVAPAITNPSGNAEYYIYRAVEMASRYCYAYATRSRDCSTTEMVLRNLCDDVVNDGYQVVHIKSDKGELEDLKIKALITGEFGASWELGTSDSSHSNAVVEHKHHVITRHAIACLLQAGLKTPLWPSAQAHVQVVFNHSISSVLQKQHRENEEIEITPAKELNRLVRMQGGQQYTYQNELRFTKVFGCLTYKYVKKTKRGGRYVRVTELCVHLSRDFTTTDGYRLLSLVTGKTSVSRNLWFDEHNISIQLTKTDRSRLHKIFSPPSEVRKLNFRRANAADEQDGLVLGPLHFVHDVDGVKHVEKLSVLEALQQHMCLVPGGSTEQLQSEVCEPFATPTTDIWANDGILDMADISQPERDVHQHHKLARDKISYLDSDVLIRNKKKSPKAPHILKRVRKMHGKTVADARKTYVLDHHGNKLLYKSADLIYDLQTRFLLIKGSQAHNSFAAFAGLPAQAADLPLVDNMFTKDSQSMYFRALAAQVYVASVTTGDTVVDAGVARIAVLVARSFKEKYLPPLGKIPKRRKDIDDMPEPYRSMWEHAFYAEQLGQMRTESFDLIPATIARNSMSYKIRKNVLVYKEKLLGNLDGKPRVDKMKVREAYMGAAQVIGLDTLLGEAPTVDGVGVRILIAISRANGWPDLRGDVPLAYLNSLLSGSEAMVAYAGDSKNKYNKYTEEFIYADTDGVPYVRWYRKGCYGGKRSAALWFTIVHSFLVNDLGFIDLKTSTCMYAYITSNGEVILVGLFVDDTFATYNSTAICWFARRFSERFGTKWFGGLQGFIGADLIKDEQADTTTLDMHSFLEQAAELLQLQNHKRVSIPIEVVPQPGELPTKSDVTKLQQDCSKLVSDAVTGLNMPVLKSKTEYLALCGIIAWAVNNAYPSFAFAVNVLQHVMHAPTEQHLVMAKRVFAMLYQKRHAGITYHGPRSAFWRQAISGAKMPESKQSAHDKLKSFLRVPDHVDAAFLCQSMAVYDANYGSNREKPQLCAVVYLAGGPTQWKSTRCKLYCTSTCESELCAAHLCSQMAIYQVKILNELRFTQRPVICLGDNQSCTTILSMEHPSRAERHFRVRSDHIRGCVQDELLTFQDIPSALNPSDLGSKAITAHEVWKYLAALMHGKIRIGAPREDFSIQYLRELTETRAIHVPSGERFKSTTTANSSQRSTAQSPASVTSLFESCEDGGVTSDREK